MIRLIAAMDSKRGLANSDGLPWQGKIPAEVEHYHKLIEGHTILMGHSTYEELVKPMPAGRNLVLSKNHLALRPGFELIDDLDTFLQNPPEDLWIIGGPKVFEQTIDRADELHLTRIEGDFHCTKFFPPFEDKFELVEEGENHQQNGINFRFCIYVKK
jgi:dihydrofolate reductase